MHLTIGEVLSLLKEEFPDVSISKIRFLESQGLVDPERTPSGYRKFYDHDVDRLRWILRQQREHFLPLKVIRGRLSGDDSESDGDPVGGSVEVDELEVRVEPVETSPVPSGVSFDGGAQGVLAVAEIVPAAHTLPAAHTVPAVPAADTTRETAPAVAVTPAAALEHAGPAAGLDNGSRPSLPTPERAESAPEPELAPVEAKPPPAPKADVAAKAEPARPARSARSVQGEADTRSSTPVTAHPDVYTAAELAGQVGCAVALITELVQYGILSTGANVGGVAYFDPPSLALARIGARFSELGVEPRHLRTWRNAAEREAGLFEQLVMPLLRQRNPQARQQAVDRLDELTRLGGDLRAGLISEAIRQIR